MTINQYFTKGRFLLEVEISVKRNFCRNPENETDIKRKAHKTITTSMQMKILPFLCDYVKY
jgi:hypothetical protein